MSVVTVAAVVGAVAAVGSAYAANKQAGAQKKSIRAQQRQADIANARERRSTIRQGRIARSSVESQAALTGLSGSSVAAGSEANITSRVGENLSFLDQNQQLSAAASKANQEAANWASRANNWNTLGSIASVTGSTFGGAKPSKLEGGDS